MDLAAHDRIHILPGRGLLTADEAFIIGFTMGSTGRVSCIEARLFDVLERHLYPATYTLDAGSVRIFRDAMRLGSISVCRPLDRVDLAP